MGAEPVTKPVEMIVDFVTGREIPDVGAEANRQAIEHFLVEAQGFAKEEVEVDVPIEVFVAGNPYRSCVDLVLKVDGRRWVVFKCAAGSLGSRERETLAAARLLDDYQVPLAVVTDGRTATVLDTASGRRLGQGLAAIPSRRQLRERLDGVALQPLPEPRREREALIFRSYDSMNVNVGRNVRST